MNQLQEKYGEYFLPALCVSIGMVIGLLFGLALGAVKGGRITMFSNNTIGSGNGSRNSAADMLLGGQKTQNEN